MLKTSCANGSSTVSNTEDQLAALGFVKREYGDWGYSNLVDIQALAVSSSKENPKSLISILCRVPNQYRQPGILIVNINYDPDEIGSHTEIGKNWQGHLVTYVFDGTPASPIKEYWELGYDSGTAVFLMYPPHKHLDREKFLTKLISNNGGHLILLTDSISGNNIFRTFSLRGATEAVIPVLQACGYELD